jgi:Ca-activated chloride channel family protein
MNRTLACGIAALCASSLAVVVAQQTPVFRGVGDAVRVFVTVTDGDGRLVTTLQREAFEVRDEGKPQPITLFDNTPQPIRLVVMLDVSGSMEGNLPLLRAASDQLFARLRPDDEVRVGTFGRDVEISPTFTRDVEVLRSALPTTIAPDAPTPLWRALDEALDAFQKDEGDARPVVLVLSDGKDSGIFEFSLSKQPVSQAEIIDRARSESVMIYAVGMRSRGRQRMPPTGGLQGMLTADLPDPGLARVAQETGGGYTEIRLSEDLGAAFARVADELHSQYLIGFAPPQRDGKKHDLDVRLNQRGMTARARKSYIAPKN